MTDEERIARVARGDKRALEQLYDQYERLVYSFALKIILDPQLAEEVVQDVFMRVWTQAVRYEPERGRFSSWLINMTRNLTIDRLRSARTRGLVSLMRSDESEREVADHAASGLADTIITSLHVREVLTVLSPDQREALDLAYWHGLTHSEIARRIKAPLGTVKSRLHHALIKLRAALQTEGREEGITRGSR